MDVTSAYLLTAILKSTLEVVGAWRQGSVADSGNKVSALTGHWHLSFLLVNVRIIAITEPQNANS